MVKKNKKKQQHRNFTKNKYISISKTDYFARISISVQKHMDFYHTWGDT